VGEHSVVRSLTVRRTGKRRDPESRNRYTEMCTADGIRFGSIPEKEHYEKLRTLQSKGRIKQLKIHPRFYFVIDEDKYSSYEADFSYVETETEQLRVEDVKAWRQGKRGLEPIVAPQFIFQKALMRLQFGIIVLEV